MNGDDVEKLQHEVRELKTKLRMTKSDRDMISKYTTQLNKDMSTLQDRVAETTQERDYYVSTLRDVKNHYNVEISRLQKDNDKLHADVENLQQDLQQQRDKYDELDVEHEKVNSELRHVNFELDVIQVDFYNSKEHCEDLQQQVRDLRRKNRNLQMEINEADRTTTKRLNRLVERLDTIEKDKNLLQDQLHIYEKELDSQGLLCFLCRAGVKTVKCDRCVEMVCVQCNENLEKCPFCRKDGESAAE